MIKGRAIQKLLDELNAAKSPTMLQRVRSIVRQHDPAFKVHQASDSELLQKTAELSLNESKSICVCVFRSNSGRAEVGSSLSGRIQSSIRLLPETGNTLIVPVAGRTYAADGYFFKVNGQYFTYKVDGSTCTSLDRLTGSTPTFSACVNLIAAALGKRAPYLVPNNEFGTGRINAGW